MIIGAPIVTEKSSLGFETGTYVLEIFSTSTKQEIKKAIKAIHGVDAVDVRVVNLPAKKKTFKRVKGVRPARHRAYVRHQKGQSFPGLELPKTDKKEKQEVK